MRLLVMMLCYAAISMTTGCANRTNYSPPQSSYNSDEYKVLTVTTQTSNETPQTTAQPQEEKRTVDATINIMFSNKTSDYIGMPQSEFEQFFAKSINPSEKNYNCNIVFTSAKPSQAKVNTKSKNNKSATNKLLQFNVEINLMKISLEKPPVSKTTTSQSWSPGSFDDAVIVRNAYGARVIGFEYTACTETVTGVAVFDISISDANGKSIKQDRESISSSSTSSWVENVLAVGYNNKVQASVMPNNIIAMPKSPSTASENVIRKDLIDKIALSVRRSLIPHLQAANK